MWMCILCELLSVGCDVVSGSRYQGDLNKSTVCIPALPSIKSANRLGLTEVLSLFVRCVPSLPRQSLGHVRRQARAPLPTLVNLKLHKDVSDPRRDAMLPYGFSTCGPGR